VFYGAIVAIGYFIIGQIPSLLYLATVVLFMLAAVFAHASLRSNTLAGRVNLELENVHLKSTVMAGLFRKAGIEIK